MAKIKVLVVDDSALIRKLMTELLNADPMIEVVGTASDPYRAREKIKKLKPDVLTLDVEMPRMDGVTFLRNLMRLHPMPVVMVSTLTEAGADVTLEALEIGAVDFVPKPKVDVVNQLDAYASEIRTKVRTAAAANMRGGKKRDFKPAIGINANSPKHSADVVLPKAPRRLSMSTQPVIAIGASTGGTEAIKAVLSEMPADAPAVVIAQHIPAMFSAPFARRMDGASAMSVKEAEDGDELLQGHVYIAPGSHHLYIERKGMRYVCRLSDGPAVNRHKPSVDVLFRSVADNAGPHAVAALLTGMGDDGAAGLLELREAGAHTIAQDEATSVVWGMPGEAVARNAAIAVSPLGRVASQLCAAVKSS